MGWKKTDWKFVNAQIPPALDQRLADRASKAMVSRADVIRAALAAYLGVDALEELHTNIVCTDKSQETDL